MANSKHEAVWDWLLTCPYITDLFFNYAQTKNADDTQLIPSELQMMQFIDGSRLMRYTVSLVRFIPISGDPNDIKNITDLVDFELVNEWVDEQNREQNFPDFPEGCIVEEVKALPNTAGFAVAQDFSSAKYMMQFQVQYIKES